MQVLDVSSCLLFHVCLLISRICTLSTPFSRPRYFVLLHTKLEFFFTLGIFRILCHRQERKVFSLVFCTHACLLISRTGILTIFFTLKMFLSVTAYASFFCFVLPTFSTPVYFFMRIDTLSTFITVRIGCSDTLSS